MSTYVKKVDKKEVETIAQHMWSYLIGFHPTLSKHELVVLFTEGEDQHMGGINLGFDGHSESLTMIPYISMDVNLLAEHNLVEYPEIEYDPTIGSISGPDAMIASIAHEVAHAAEHFITGDIISCAEPFEDHSDNWLNIYFELRLIFT